MSHCLPEKVMGLEEKLDYSYLAICFRKDKAKVPEVSCAGREEAKLLLSWCKNVALFGLKMNK